VLFSFLSLCASIKNRSIEMAKKRTFYPENSSADADFRHSSNLARSLVQSLMRGLHRLALALLVGLLASGVVSGRVKKSMDRRQMGNLLVFCYRGNPQAVKQVEQNG
jgi:hypothetical protein